MIDKAININLPYNIKIILWKNVNKTYTKTYLINSSKVIKIIFNKKSIKIDKWLNSIIFLKKKNWKEGKKIENKINKFLKSTYIYYFNKIKFKGKGFRIKSFKTVKILKFFFGKSHKTFFFLKKIKKKKINKYKFIIASLSENKIKLLSKKITKIKSINVYTLRGLRSSKQIIFKRKGKKGTYI